MNSEIIIAGFGGQGILFAGKVLAYTGMIAGKEVSWLPSYGPEMRGGTANCHVIVSETPVASPLIVRPTVLLCMNLPSLKKFEKSVLSGGYIAIDSTLIPEKEVERDDVRVLAVPATRLADEMGAVKLANMVLLGAYIKASGFADLDVFFEGLQKSVPKSKAELFELNKKAVLKGYELF